MAISDDLNSIRTHLEDDYTALEQLGISVEDKNIENIKDMANQIYAKFPKTDYAEGSNITLSNTLKGKLDFEDGIVVYGQTKQKSTQGYNLYYIDKNDYQQTWNNIDFTLTKTGYKVYSANSQASTGFTITSRKITLPAGVYTFVLKHTSALRIAFSNMSYAVLGIIEIGSTYTSFSINDETDVALTLLPANGASYNEENEIMLYSGNYSSSKTFEDYSGGYASPSPNWEQDIEVVRGKNLFDKDSATLGKSFDGNNGNIINNDNLAISDYISVISNKTYCVSNFSTSTFYLIIIEYNASKEIINIRTNTTSQTSNTHTMTSNTKYIRFNMAKTSVNTVQLEEGSTATSYLPYNTIEVVERGKNAFAFETNSTKTWNGLDITMNNSSVTINGTSANTSSIYAYGFNLKPLKLIGTYKLSGYTRNDSYLQLYWKDKNGNIKYKEMKNNPTITFDEGDYLFQLFIFASSGTIMTFNDETFNIMLEKGDTITNFIPYEETTKQLSLGDKEPAKTDIADEFIYDIDNDKVYLDKNTRKVVFNGTETWTMTQTAAGYRFRIDLSGIKASASNAAIPKLYCDKLIANSLDNIWTIGGNCMGLFSSFGGVVVICLADLSIDTIDKFKTWLASNNLTAYLPLAETSREEITGTLKEQIKDIYNLMSYTGTTIIEIDGQLPLIIKVRALKGE